MSETTRRAALWALLLLLACAAGFTRGIAPSVDRAAGRNAVSGSNLDERGRGAMSKDQQAANSIKGRLLDKDRKKGLAVKVHCYSGQAFLVGQVDDVDFRHTAVQEAREVKGVRKVTAFFLPESDTAARDQDLAARVRAKIKAESGLVTARIQTEVLDGVAVLLGQVQDAKEVKKAVNAAQAVDGVQRVQSFLLVGGQ